MILGSFGVYDRCIIEWCSSFRALRYLKITIAPLIIEKEKMLTQKSVRNRQILRLGQSFGTKWHGQHLKYLRYHRKSSRKSR